MNVALDYFFKKGNYIDDNLLGYYIDKIYFSVTADIPFRNLYNSKSIYYNLWDIKDIEEPISKWSAFNRIERKGHEYLNWNKRNDIPLPWYFKDLFGLIDDTFYRTQAHFFWDYLLYSDKKVDMVDMNLNIQNTITGRAVDYRTQRRFKGKYSLHMDEEMSYVFRYFNRRLISKYSLYLKPPRLYIKENTFLGLRLPPSIIYLSKEEEALMWYNFYYKRVFSKFVKIQRYGSPIAYFFNPWLFNQKDIDNWPKTFIFYTYTHDLRYLVFVDFRKYIFDLMFKLNKRYINLVTLNERSLLNVLLEKNNFLEITGFSFKVIFLLFFFIISGLSLDFFKIKIYKRYFSGIDEPITFKGYKYLLKKKSRKIKRMFRFYVNFFMDMIYSIYEFISLSNMVYLSNVYMRFKYRLTKEKNMSKFIDTGVFSHRYMRINRAYILYDIFVQYTLRLFNLFAGVLFRVFYFYLLFLYKTLFTLVLYNFYYIFSHWNFLKYYLYYINLLITYLKNKLPRDIVLFFYNTLEHLKLEFFLVITNRFLDLISFFYDIISRLFPWNTKFYSKNHWKRFDFPNYKFTLNFFRIITPLDRSRKIETHSNVLLFSLFSYLFIFIINTLLDFFINLLVSMKQTLSIDLFMMKNNFLKKMFKFNGNDFIFLCILNFIIYFFLSKFIYSLMLVSLFTLIYYMVIKKLIKNSNQREKIYYVFGYFSFLFWDFFVKIIRFFLKYSLKLLKLILFISIILFIYDLLKVPFIVEYLLSTWKDEFFYFLWYYEPEIDWLYNLFMDSYTNLFNYETVNTMIESAYYGRLPKQKFNSLSFIYQRHLSSLWDDIIGANMEWDWRYWRDTFRHTLNTQLFLDSLYETFSSFFSKLWADMPSPSLWFNFYLKKKLNSFYAYYFIYGDFILWTVFYKIIWVYINSKYVEFYLNYQWYVNYLIPYYIGSISSIIYYGFLSKMLKYFNSFIFFNLCKFSFYESNAFEFYALLIKNKIVLFRVFNEILNFIYYDFFFYDEFIYLELDFFEIYKNIWAYMDNFNFSLKYSFINILRFPLDIYEKSSIYRNNLHKGLVHRDFPTINFGRYYNQKFEEGKKLIKLIVTTRSNNKIKYFTSNNVSFIYDMNNLDYGVRLSYNKDSMDSFKNWKGFIRYKPVTKERSKVDEMLLLANNCMMLEDEYNAAYFIKLNTKYYDNIYTLYEEKKYYYIRWAYDIINKHPESFIEIFDIWLNPIYTRPWNKILLNYLISLDGEESSSYDYIDYLKIFKLNQWTHRLIYFFILVYYLLFVFFYVIFFKKEFAKSFNVDYKWVFLKNEMSYDLFNDYDYFYNAFKVYYKANFNDSEKFPKEAKFTREKITKKSKKKVISFGFLLDYYRFFFVDILNRVKLSSSRKNFQKDMFINLKKNDSSFLSKVIYEENLVKNLQNYNFEKNLYVNNPYPFFWKYFILFTEDKSYNYDLSSNNDLFTFYMSILMSKGTPGFDLLLYYGFQREFNYFIDSFFIYNHMITHKLLDYFNELDKFFTKGQGSYWMFHKNDSFIFFNDVKNQQKEYDIYKFNEFNNITNPLLICWFLMALGIWISLLYPLNIVFNCDHPGDLTYWIYFKNLCVNNNLFYSLHFLSEWSDYYSFNQRNKSFDVYEHINSPRRLNLKKWNKMNLIIGIAPTMEESAEFYDNLLIHKKNYFYNLHGLDVNYRYFLVSPRIMLLNFVVIFIKFYFLMNLFFYSKRKVQKRFNFYNFYGFSMGYSHKFIALKSWLKTYNFTKYRGYLIKFK